MDENVNDTRTTLENLKKLVAQYRDDRGWGKHHTPKNLSMSIAIEAAELMELFQWDEYTRRNQDKIADELADVLIYCFNFADTTDIDISTAFRNKLRKAAEKYPIELFKPGQDSPEEYNRIKQEHRKGRR
ncbi:MAG: nucleotide pyrophosphohydrolase [Candidatus Saccharibacteria bacterium]|nr:nucleotide pyrophosphohydrolase [Candidatus Saccharibacteria bacterium]